LGELVEKGVVAFVRGPNGEIVSPGDTALGSLPEEFCIWMFGEFVEADVAAVNGHGLWVSGESNNARAVIELYVTDFDFFGNCGATRTGHLDFEVIFAVRDDRLGEVVDAGEHVSDPHVFECARVIFGCEEVVAPSKAQALANVFECIGVGPADADGFFGECEDLFFLSVEFVFGANPRDLVWEKVFAEERILIDGDGGEDGAHNKSLNR